MHILTDKGSHATFRKIKFCSTRSDINQLDIQHERQGTQDTLWPLSPRPQDDERQREELAGLTSLEVHVVELVSRKVVVNFTSLDIVLCLTGKGAENAEAPIARGAILEVYLGNE